MCEARRASARGQVHGVTRGGTTHHRQSWRKRELWRIVTGACARLAALILVAGRMHGASTPG